MKKILLILTLMLTCWQAASAYDFMVNGIAYDKNSDGNTVKVTCTNHVWNTLDYENYSGSQTITQANIPETVSNGGKTYTVTSIGEQAFSGCSTFTTFEIPTSVASIGASAFQGCTGLISMEIPAKVTTLLSGTFSNCTNLTSVTFAEGSLLESIGSTFANSGLVSIEIPAKVSTIASGTFHDCKKLESVTFAEGSQLTTFASEAFNICINLTTIDIPESVTTINNSAFSGCSGLTSLIIPKNVERIGDYAFLGCGFKYLVFLAENPPSLDNEIFDEIPEDIVIYVPNDNYKNWGGFTNFKGVYDYKTVALNEIDAAMNGATLTDAEKGAISNYKDQINSASDLAAVIAAKEAALAIIKLHPTKAAALAEIQAEMDGIPIDVSSAYNVFPASCWNKHCHLLRTKHLPESRI